MSEDIRALAVDLAKAETSIRTGVSQAMRKTGQDIAARAQQLVPVDTGATKNSIGVDSAEDGLEVVVGPTTSYAPYLENGTWKMAPRPFMGPAADASLPALENAIAQAMGGALW